MNFILHSFHNHEYISVFLLVFLDTVGLPIPAELALFTAGALLYGHPMALASVIVIGATAAVMGDALLFFIGWRVATERERRMVNLYCSWTYCTLGSNYCHQRARRYINRFDARTLLFSKFLFGARQFVPPVAGMAHTPPVSFLVFNTFGCLLWTTVFTVLGVLLRNSLSILIDRFEQFRSLAAVAVVLVVGAFFFWKVYQFRRHGNPKFGAADIHSQIAKLSKD